MTVFDGSCSLDREAVPVIVFTDSKRDENGAVPDWFLSTGFVPALLYSLLTTIIIIITI